MKGNDELNLTACLLALLRYNGSLPSDLHTQIQQAQTQLSQNQHQAIQSLRSAIQQHEPLGRLYSASRTQLFSQYQSQERAKSAAVITAPPSERSTAKPSVRPTPTPVAQPTPTSIPQPTSLPTLAKVREPSGQYVTEQDRIDIVKLATAILNSPNANYRTQTQKLFNQPAIKRQLESAPESLKASAHVLEMAASELHPTQVALMKRLDQRILTVDDLAYALGISIESARQYVKTLWNEKYIRPISGSFIKQIWLSVKGPELIDAPPADDTYLKLTAKGYFYLHPSSLSKRKVA